MTSSQQTGRSSVVGSSSQPDYAAVNIPSKPPTEYDHVERRAELLQQVRDLGHPSMIHQGEAAERYGVSQQQISKDLDRIAEYVGENLGARHELTIDAVFQRSIQGLLEEGEYRKAARTAKDYDEWVTDRTDLEEIREQLEFLKDVHDV
ncbi:hypothetical protein [Halopenitus persicus]|uniref:Uncharacterized protein n=1 Tax=Halopenitus persicus TaxID=1048396 RepID=A0A1H3PAW3_9EURY|nr:hypothetical protein [Halopenitus persicus]SDY98083.1 hypothetical protein SAMN05216564_1232 [Halopenitus persicus]